VIQAVLALLIEKERDIRVNTTSRGRAIKEIEITEDPPDLEIATRNYSEKRTILIL
jgi:hypothetical protein